VSMPKDVRDALVSTAPAEQLRLDQRVVALTAWQRWLLAFGLGVLSVLAMPPFGVWPVLAVTLPGLVLLLDAAAGLPSMRTRLRHGAAIGWWFGFGYFVPGLYWIGSAFLVEADKFAWLMPFAVTALPAALGLFFAAAGLAAVALWRPGPQRLLVLTVALSASEWLRGTIFTGFPWNALGYALTSQDALLQSAALIGVHGLTLIAVLTLSTPVLLTQSGLHQASWRWPALAATVLFVMTIGGLWRLPSAPMATHPDLQLLLVQPNTPEAVKFQAAAQRDIYNSLLELSDVANSPLAGKRRVVIWPETPVNALLLDDPAALAQMGARIGAGNLLITGTIRRSTSPEGQPEVFNSLIVIDSVGTVQALYDKAHLVPFGEYLPFQSALESIGLESLTRQRGGFAAGLAVRTISPDGMPPFSPLICYEVIFPGAVVDPANRPAWLLNITNDAWFGISTGPYQHLHQARVRAVEEGLPMVRVAGTGISAVIDPYGRITNRLALDSVGVLNAELPLPLSPTLYARFGNFAFALLFVLTLFGLGLRGEPARPDRRKP
jgi:apolipoprotein N-acyltransferase